MLIQLYGITTGEDGAMVDALGPDHVGVALDEGIETWDCVEEAVAEDIARRITRAKLVALSLSTDGGRVRRTVAVMNPHIVHLARAAEGMRAEEVALLRAEISPVEVMVTVPVRGPEALEVARRFAPVSDYLLLDTADPASGTVGATGLTHDWGLSASIVGAVEIPVILAGGLCPENVLEAIARVRPAGVDSETGTSRSDNRRRKDPEKVARFIELVRSLRHTSESSG